MKWRKPDEQVTVVPGRSTTAEEAFEKINRFAELCTITNVDIVDTIIVNSDSKPERGSITVSGRPRNIARFKMQFANLKALGLV